LRERRDGTKAVRIEPACEPLLVFVELRPQELRGPVEMAQQGRELAELMVAQPLRRPPLRCLQLVQDGNDLGVERVRHSGPDDIGQVRQQHQVRLESDRGAVAT
jgi:hypothetical protein